MARKTALTWHFWAGAHSFVPLAKWPGGCYDKTIEKHLKMNLGG